MAAMPRVWDPLKQEKQWQGTDPVHVPPGEPPSQESEGVSRALRNKGEGHRVHLVHNCQGQRAGNRVGTEQVPNRNQVCIRVALCP
jgi:hypothetical protein